MAHRLPQSYYMDIPAYMMEEIITGMMEGKQQPTPEEMEEWHSAELQREAELLLAEYR